MVHVEVDFNTRDDEGRPSTIDVLQAFSAGESRAEAPLVEDLGRRFRRST
jgi:hypothetical protein